jgi:hypothetical protein
MRADPSNPANNVLPPSTRDESIVSAIELSGYPLQGIVAEKLLTQGFHVAEEWGYADRDKELNRPLDLYASLSFPPEVAGKLDASLSLLIECKKSVHPYVFFSKVADRGVHEYPPVEGCPVVQLLEGTGASGRRETKSVQDFLGASELDFITTPPLCSILSRATLDAKRAELSGEESYNTIILPLVKAMDYHHELWKGMTSNFPLSPIMALPICVLDAAMVLVESPTRIRDPILTPWIRVARHEAIVRGRPIITSKVLNTVLVQ